jgi:hypothetical protein
MERETRTDSRIRELKASVAMMERIAPMISTQDITNMARAFVAAEIVMAAVNYGASKATRARAEKLLDDYFALVEQAVCWTEQNPLDRRC